MRNSVSHIADPQFPSIEYNPEHLKGPPGLLDLIFHLSIHTDPVEGGGTTGPSRALEDGLLPKFAHWCPQSGLPPSALKLLPWEILPPPPK